MNTKQLLYSFILLMCVTSLIATRQYVAILRVDYGQVWGNWHTEEFCPEGQFAFAYNMKIEPRLGKNGDDTSLNGIRLYCDTPKATLAGNSITSGVGPWGDWHSSETRCGRTGEFLTSFRLQVEYKQGDGDDTAANFINFRCRYFAGRSSRDEYELSQSPGHGFWGNFGHWSPSCPTGSAICGLSTKIEPHQGRADDTALNDVIFYCCNI